MTIGKLSGQCDFGQKGQSYCNQRGQSCVAKRVKVAWLFQAYPFSIETLPVPKRLKVGETAEIRCRLVRGGYYQPTTYQIRYFQPDGKGKLEMDNGTVLLLNDLYPLEKETFRLYYTSASTDQQTIDIYIIDSFGQMQQLSFSFNNDSSEEE